MNKKTTVLGLFVGLCLALSALCSAQAEGSSRVIRIEITNDGRFVPDRILIIQDEEIVFRVTVSQSNELTWPSDVLHGFYLMYDNIVLIEKTIKRESGEKNKATIEIKWTPRFTGEFTLRCPYHRHQFGTVTVKQRF